MSSSLGPNVRHHTDRRGVAGAGGAHTWTASVGGNGLSRVALAIWPCTCGPGPSRSPAALPSPLGGLRLPHTPATTAYRPAAARSGNGPLGPSLAPAHSAASAGAPTPPP
ncbi:hypothetical protein TSOC_001271 [Tetrabaena socialis]|uniref:Uncharacterized protein n=1 Tax=Tetrabaena socialis TaxID=47790 RepID=A0A2J8AH82_9CHLO|nr:hypothetical protein TSOC_001271 [Tetrabaena socialis]|eukprot:PNH11846.1 hypothetical protein TSOC_001271 [Tetrabaena socialis]